MCGMCLFVHRWTASGQNSVPVNSRAVFCLLAVCKGSACGLDWPGHQRISTLALSLGKLGEFSVVVVGYSVHCRMVSCNPSLPLDASSTHFAPSCGTQECVCVFVCVCVCVCLVAQSCPNLWNPLNCSQTGSSVHWTLQARILEWVAISYSREYSQSRD